MAVFASEPLHPLSVDDYHRMIEAGILGEDDRVELLEGVLVEKMTEGPAHAEVIWRLARHLILAFAGRDDLKVRTGNPVTLPPRSEPEPDLAVVDAADATFTAHPSRAHLVIEVSSSSRRIDRGRKLAIYARAGIPGYWIVDPVESVIEVHRQPTGDLYAEVERHPAGATVAPAALEVPPIDVGALLTP